MYQISTIVAYNLCNVTNICNYVFLFARRYWIDIFCRRLQFFEHPVCKVSQQKEYFSGNIISTSALLRSNFNVFIIIFAICQKTKMKSFNTVCGQFIIVFILNYTRFLELFQINKQKNQKLSN